MRTSRVVAAAAAVLVALALPGAASAGTTKVVQVEISTRLATGWDFGGAVLTLIQVCPAGASLDPAASRVPVPSGTLRLVNRVLWPAGMVTRWRSAGGGFGEVRVDTWCRQVVSATTRTYAASVRTITRLWGPVTPLPDIAGYDYGTQDRIWLVAGRQQPISLAWRTMRDVSCNCQLVNEPGTSMMEADVRLLRPVAAGDYSELKLALAFRAPV